MNTRLLAATAIATALLLAVPSAANDSSAAIGLGGLELTQNAAISMDSEELFISREKVTVKYRFTNTSDKDVETLVSFPLPSVPGGIEGYLGDQTIPDWKDSLQFKTLVDGKPVQLTVREEVTLFGRPEAKNVEKRLSALGWPVQFWSDYEFEGRLQDLPAAQKKAYSEEGLLRQEDGSDYVFANWQVTTHITRMQRFPAGNTITVEHSYVPVAGGSVGGMLSSEVRKSDPEMLRHYQKNYCVDKNFVTAFDKKNNAMIKRNRAKDEEYGLTYVEHWVDYVLKSGANWKGPIKDFRLVVDKGKAENLVSFCAEGVKKIGPTQFEVRKTDFEPQKDLNILIVEFYDFEDN